MFCVDCSQIMFRTEHGGNTPRERVSTDPKKGQGGGAFGAAPFVAHKEVFPWCVHTVFDSEQYEHSTRTTAHEHVHMNMNMSAPMVVTAMTAPVAEMTVAAVMVVCSDGSD